MEEKFNNLHFDPQTFDRYGEILRELRTRKYPLMGMNIVYPAMGIAGEAGELLDKIKKHWRNTTDGAVNHKFGMDSISLTTEQKVEIVKEMGDVLWYIWALSEEIGVELSSVAAMNLRKLADRKERGTICSTGDNR